MSLLKTCIGKSAKFLDKISDSKITRFAINKVIRDFGELRELRINRAENKISTSLHLHGEEKPIILDITAYELAKGDEQTTMTIQSATSDRLWLDAVLDKMVIGKTFEIPEQHSHIVNEFLKH